MIDAYTRMRLRAACCTHVACVQGKMEKEERDALIAKGQQLKERLADFEGRLRDLEGALQAEAQRLPNMTHPDVAVGGEDAAVLLREVGSKPAFDFEVRPGRLPPALRSLVATGIRGNARR